MTSATRARATATTTTGATTMGIFGRWPKGQVVRGPAIVIGLALAAASAGCRSDGGTPPPLFTAADDPTGTPAEAPAEADPKAPVPEPHRDLWFAEGPGREAILARERGDHDGARALLDQLLADPKISADDRGAALWLRGLEERASGDFAAAAGRFAEARKAPAMAAFDARLRVLEAQARLDSGQPSQALDLLADLPAEGALAGSILLASADAHQRTGDRAGAIALYERFLKEQAAASRRHETRAKLAELLAQGSDPDELRRALDLYQTLMLEVPLSDYGAAAAAAIPGLKDRIGGPRSVVAEADTARKQALARLAELLARGRYDALLKEVDAFLHTPKLAASDRCQALFLRASAVFKQRKRAASRPKYEQAAAECHKAGDFDTEVRARYQAGRGRYAEGAYDKAGKDFESLATAFPDHSYADDAWILAGESWAEAGERGREKVAYEKALAVSGDMAEEARRRLLIAAFVGQRFDDALRLADGGIAAAPADPTERAKLRYYRGRALQRLGRASEAEDAWVAAIAEAPLGYPAILALSRLRDAGDPALARGVAILEAAGDGPAISLDLPDAPAARRARALARLGLGEEAQGELSEAAITGWPAAAVLAQAGLYAESQRLIGALGRGWRRSPPVGPARKLWELAHPLAFEEIIRAGEPLHQVPHFLTFAIMQTESRFDPGAVSWAGARGLVQLMPGTAKDVAQKGGITGYNAARLSEPAFNLDLGMRYLGRLVSRFGADDEVVPLAIPSYNAGPGAVDKWLTKQGDRDFDLFIESIPFDETRKYTQSVMERWLIYRWVYGGSEQKAAERLPYIPLKIPGGVVTTDAAKSG